MVKSGNFAGWPLTHRRAYAVNTVENRGSLAHRPIILYIFCSHFFFDFFFFFHRRESMELDFFRVEVE